MSSAKASRSLSSVIALPPYLITIVAPWNSSSQGSASVSVAALRSAASRSRDIRSPSRRVRGVLVHVGVGQVGGPDRGRPDPGLQVHGDAHASTGQVDQLPRLTGLAVAADPDA